MIKKILSVVGLLILVLVLVGIFSLTQELEPGNDETVLDNELVTVNFVYDGDTIRVKFNNGQYDKVRIIGVDTPEVQSQYTVKECFSIEASEFTRNNLLDKKVTLEKDPLVKDRDQYDRLLRYIRLEDGTLFSQQLLLGGYATVYESENFQEKEAFRKLEFHAKASGFGLWGACSEE